MNAPKETRKILALDPATHCGYAHSDGYRGVWNLGDKKTSGQKFESLRSHVQDAYQRWGFDVLAYEDSASGAIRFATAKFHGQIAGVLLLTAEDLGVETQIYQPASIKKFATGNGRATKDQVVRACRTVLGLDCKSDDEADACVILEMARQLFRTNREVAKRAKKARKKNPRLF